MDNLILRLFDFFDYFSLHPNFTSKVQRVMTIWAEEGWAIWRAGQVQDVEGHPGHFVVSWESPVGDKGPRDFAVRLGDEPRCVCWHFAQTGKRCSHLWAALNLDTFGNHTEWIGAYNPLCDRR